ncbi:hypothetical protein ElyMa_002429100 [Elysia marginata]|uniref:Uncharacterized protein n=1 Tax=Elysia marginata TaxID=1093978 RepID=A0AAV4GIN4_9GAST|nr:hypothetical protein ElyMa_002429100 [Elysia marginata]
MRLSLLICVFGFLGAVCLTPAESSHRQKRVLFPKLLGIILNGATKKVVKGADKIIDKTVDKTVDIAKDVARVSKKVYFKTSDFVEDSIDWVDNAAHDVADGVVDAAKFTAKLSKKVGKGVAKISKKVYKKAYNAAKKTFDKIKQLAGKVDFDDTVLWLIDALDSETATTACHLLCVASVVAASTTATPVFPSAPAVAAFLAELACPPLCEAVLAKMQDFAEKIADKKGLGQD